MKINKLDLVYVKVIFEKTLIIITKSVMSLIKPLHLFDLRLWGLVTRPKSERYC